MLSPAVVESLNEQVNREFYSAYLYLAMSSWCERQSFAGFAHWLRLQAQEELKHAVRLYDHLLDRGAVAKFPAIPEPPTEFASLLDVFTMAYEHEQAVTGSIYALNDLATNERSYGTQAELTWFVTEQVEEEKNAGFIVAQLKMAGDSSAALLMLDREMATRTLAAQAAKTAAT